jgi:hypothetical protein
MLSVQINSSANPKLAMIPVKSVAELKRPTIGRRLCRALISEHGIHTIFEANLTNLNADANGVKRPATLGRRDYSNRKMERRAIINQTCEAGAG